MGIRVHRRVAINVGTGFVPGTNAVVMGAAIAGGKLGWEMLGIRDGFDGLLHPECYPDGGLVALSPQLVENLDPATGGILGQAPAVDPFHVRTSGENEVDLSDALLNRLKAENIDSLISVVGVQGLGILYKLHRKGLHTVCIPRSVENDIAATAISFGFNSALSVTIEMLNKAYQAANCGRSPWWRSWRAGRWIAPAGRDRCRTDAVLMLEIPTLKLLAGRLKDKNFTRRPHGLVVVAQGAKLVDNPDEPLRSGQAAETVAKGCDR
jgi:6-phosphofructokinase 1